MNDPTSRDRRASPRSRSGSRIRESSRPPSRQYADGGGPDSSVDVHDLFMDMGEQYQEQPGETLERAIIERETVNFLEYVRSILRDAKTNSLMFSEVTAAHRRRDVAAAAFYHILTLSTMGRMRPTQAAPYGDVCIELVE
ncbi:hypothetical protein BC939DRAFT_457077 [Gamsiella multidivaricata]|uniref:uncharacterized protein n=1 Tax=Gamsiella multidivaricata TaxID=101098 RepID=UPI0022205429|nr:uncharacterized protein BC939DRAFT_457077 [Gamsiella multidivaricata]KAI7820839.1 hypothetical protein BC939DRAFT_457077 [Gamsiella multidivaricata]